MKIAVLSGKGGTGKTLVSVNLAAASERSLYLDCDVEEPNGHLFFKPEQVKIEEVSVVIPLVDQELCTGCRKCVDFCRFNALAYVNDQLIVFEEICHSCGGCFMVCPENALRKKDKVIGRIERGQSGNVEVHTGILNTGEVSGIPIVAKLLEGQKDRPDIPVFIDCPPGTACIVMETIAGADYCILVAEPTIFGSHNLKMVHELVVLMEKPFGVVLNKCQEGVNPSEEYCLQHDIKILGKIPYDPRLGLLNSQAQIAVRVDDHYKTVFSDLLTTARKETTL
ncbi:MAG TPA: ATP-binding protein [Clostridia bacterium]|nr:ATP-binding protein [Clostridia bacterium]